MSNVVVPQNIKDQTVSLIKNGMSIKDAHARMKLTCAPRCIYDWVSRSTGKGMRSRKVKKAVVAGNKFQEFVLNNDQQIKIELANGIKLTVGIGQLKSVVQALAGEALGV